MPNHEIESNDRQTRPVDVRVGFNYSLRLTLRRRTMRPRLWVEIVAVLNVRVYGSRIVHRYLCGVSESIAIDAVWE